jgi:hypothetical protein
MTFSELVERAKRQLNAGQGQPRAWPESEIDLAACAKQALASLARQVMADEARRTLLQQTYSVSLDGAGVGSPLAASGSVTGLTGEILMEGIWYGSVIDASNNVLAPIIHYADFLRPQPLAYAYYCLKDRKILTRAKNVPVNGPADIVGVTGPLTITASFEPAKVENVPSELENDLVNALCDIVARKTPAVTMT